ncbi:phospholipase D-like protein [Paenibacillus cellulosilyticus]|uniref:Phospholipase D-like protein n=1 Tax=Paenibacillus cellulosilyticus TaxID=375489 RepID=A0A2V2YVH0_9BACL|nr:PLDc N-terminal domain-containing protein [Paenibacillus cellulosilyticus]PWW02460.1 phospholipase D-like protein [Paenibacillus cellulosilyticus]
MNGGASAVSGIGNGFAFMFVIFVLFSLLFFVLHIVSIVWAYRDAVRRGNEPIYALGVAALIFFFPIIGLIVYLLIRSNR